MTLMRRRQKESDTVRWPAKRFGLTDQLLKAFYAS